MNLIVQQKLSEDKKMNDFLKQNSYWIKELNRDDENYKKYVNEMKKKYRLNMTDKISDTIDNIDIITSVLQTLA